MPTPVGQTIVFRGLSHHARRETLTDDRNRSSVLPLNRGLRHKLPAAFSRQSGESDDRAAHHREGCRLGDGTDVAVKRRIPESDGR